MYVPEFSDYKWYSEKEQEFIQAVKKRNKKVVVFGTGYYGKRVWEICRNEVDVDYFCDNDSKKWHTKIEGITVLSPQKLSEHNLVNDYTVIVSPRYFHGETIDMLLQAGIEKSNIYRYADYAAMSLKNQYFDDKILYFKQEEIFVDGGCFNFGTSEIFINIMRKIGLNNVELVCAGMWSSDGYLHFSVQKDGASHIRLGESTDKDLVKVIALDSHITEEVTFIKMDIEGAELEALKGAKSLIRKYKPKLAVCIYHKEDLWEIPYYIKCLCQSINYI